MSAHNAKPERNMELWIMRKGGARFKDIAARFGISAERAKEIFASEDRRSRSEIREIANVLNKRIATGQWTFEGR